MPQLQRIAELEQLLVVANEAITKLTVTNTELTKQVSDAETRNRKLKRSSRKDESNFKDQLLLAQTRRG